jgi:hypothetical protein
MRLAALVLIAGCAYKPDSFHSFSHPFIGEHVSAGCLDLAIERRPDLIGGGAVLGYEFGNRCDRPAVVDLARVNVVGRTFDGRELNLAVWDPRHEIHPASLDGRAIGNEALAYKSKEAFAEVCVDAASIAHATPERWVCFATAQQLAIKEAR